MTLVLAVGRTQPHGYREFFEVWADRWAIQCRVTGDSRRFPEQIKRPAQYYRYTQLTSDTSNARTYFQDLEWPLGRRNISRIIGHISSTPQDIPVQEVSSWLLKGKGKGRTLDIAPQVDMATTKALRCTWRAPSSVAHTCLIPSQQ